MGTEWEDHIIGRTLAIESYGNKVARDLTRISMTAVNRLRRRMERISEKSQFTRGFLHRVIGELSGTIYKLAPKYQKTLEKASLRVLELEYDKFTRVMRKKGGLSIKKANYKVPVEAAKAMLEEPIGGASIKGWAEKHLGRLLIRTKNLLTEVVITGGTMRDGIKILRENIPNMSRKGAQFLARTGVMHASNTARDEVWKEYGDIIEKFRVVSTLDNRTCLACGKIDGKEAKKRENLPKFPLHGNCRCTVIGLTALDLRDEDKLVRPAVIEQTSHTVHHRDGGTSKKFKVIKSKEVSAKKKFKDFFERQPEKWKQEYLGPGRYKLYKENRLDLEDFSSNGNILTLEQLKSQLTIMGTLEKEVVEKEKERKKEVKKIIRKKEAEKKNPK